MPQPFDKTDPALHSPNPSSDQGNPAYTVQAGDTLLSVASKYGIARSALARANGVDQEETLTPGTVLIIPPGANLTGSASWSPGEPFTAQTEPAKKPQGNKPYEILVNSHEFSAAQLDALARAFDLDTVPTPRLKKKSEVEDLF